MTLALVALGLAGLAMTHRRKRASAGSNVERKQ